MIPSAYRSRLAVVNKIQYCVALRRDGLCDTQRRRLVIIYTPRSKLLTTLDTPAARYW